MNKIFRKTILTGAVLVFAAVFVLSAQPLATVKTVVGSVMIKDVKTASARAAVNGDKLKAGEMLLTAAGARAIVTLLDGSTIVVKPSSVMTINQNLVKSKTATYKTSVGLMAGAVSLSVIKGGGSDIKVNTPTAIAAVRGTEFDAVLALDGSSAVTVTSGQVRMDTDGGGSDLGPGMGGSVIVGEEATGVAPLDTDAGAFLQQRNDYARANPAEAMNKLKSRMQTISERSQTVGFDSADPGQSEAMLNQLENGGEAIKTLAQQLVDENPEMAELQNGLNEIETQKAQLDTTLTEKVKKPLEQAVAEEAASEESEEVAEEVADETEEEAAGGDGGSAAVSTEFSSGAGATTGFGDGASSAASGDTGGNGSAAVNTSESSKPEGTEEKEEKEGSKEEGEDEKSSVLKIGNEKFKLGFGVSSVLVDGQMWTRVNLLPEFRIKKFGMALDLELFIDEEGNLSDKSWTFENPQQAVNSILRKIYYVSWSSMDEVVFGEDKFHFKFGALEGLTLGSGLILYDYENTLNYPVEKKLGLQIAFGNLTRLNMGLQAFVADFNDFTRTGGLLGGRYFIHPFAPASDGALGRFQIGATFVADINQYSGLADSDDDGYVDEIDMFADDPDRFADTDGDGFSDSEDIDADGDNKLDSSEATGEVDTNTYFDSKDKTDMYFMFGGDLVLPITKRLSFYGEFAMAMDPDYKEGTNSEETNRMGWGLTAPGVRWKLGEFLDLTLDYRLMRGYFRPSYFDRRYDEGRAFVNESGKILGKDSTVEDLTVHGIYGNLLVNAQILYVEGTYELFVDGDDIGQSLMGYEARAYVNREFVEQIEQLDKFLGDAEVFVKHDYVTINQVTNENNGYKIFGKSLGFSLGAKLGINLAETTQVLYEYELGYKYDSSGELVADNKMSISTEITF